MEEIEEIPHNLCGVIAERFVIKGPVDEPVGKGFLQYHLHDDDPAADKTANNYMILARHPLDSSVHRIIRVLETVSSKSVHFPVLLKTGKFKELVYGYEGEQDVERDPEWGGRAFAILRYDATPLSTLTALSPTRVLPAKLALMIGIGCIRALAALHRAGFVHRLVSPFSFSFTNPPTVDNFLGRMLITDLSLVLPWPVRPRHKLPFVGSLRYSSARVHWGREQGPSDDIISVIYMIAEFIHGKLPWRSVVYDDQTVCQLKTDFYMSIQFQKLPHEVRQVYRTMYRTLGPSPIDHVVVLKQFMSALARYDPQKAYQLPTWLHLGEKA